MSPRYGIVAKAYTEKPKADSVNTTLDLYILSYNSAGNLTIASNALKNNLKTYINQYRMIGDTISIKDAFIINIACDFEIITLPNYNNNEVILRCISALQTYFSYTISILSSTSSIFNIRGNRIKYILRCSRI